MTLVKVDNDITIPLKQIRGMMFTGCAATVVSLVFWAYAFYTFGLNALWAFVIVSVAQVLINRLVRPVQ